MVNKLHQVESIQLAMSWYTFHQSTDKKARSKRNERGKKNAQFTCIISINKRQKVINWTFIHMLFFDFNILKHVRDQFLLNVNTQQFRILDIKKVQAYI